MPSQDSKQTKSISFVRHYNGYTGGHQKVRDYMQHFMELGYQTSLFLDGQSANMPDLFNNISKMRYQNNYDPSDADIVFLAGMDWHEYIPLSIANKPVINLIQHVRHADPKEPLFTFLSQPAVRICVSQSVKKAILPYANGPVHTIPMGHKIPARPLKKTNDLYILENKQPELGRQLASLFRDKVTVICHDHYVEKQIVLSAMASSRVSVTLPHQTEGFYLPGIEAMTLSDIAVIPDCVASVEYSKYFSNALRCTLDYEDIVSTINRALQFNYSGAPVWFRKRIGRTLVSQYSLLAEKRNLEKIARVL